MSRNIPESFPVRKMEDQVLPIHNIAMVQDRLAKDIDSLKGVSRFVYDMFQELDGRLGELEKGFNMLEKKSGKAEPRGVSSLPSEPPGEAPQKKEITAVLAIPIPKEAVKIKGKPGRSRKEKKWGKPGRRKKPVRQLAEEQLKLVYNPDTDPIKNGVDDDE